VRLPPWDQTGVPGFVGFTHFHSSTISGLPGDEVAHFRERLAAPVAKFLDLLSINADADFTT